MCFMVYMASSEPLPLVKQEKSTPTFHTRLVSVRERIVRRQFSFPHVYYVGSYTGCGCGFLKDGEVGEELLKTEAMYQDLAGFIGEAISQGSEIELFSCWVGEQGAVPVKSTTITLEEMVKPEFEFQEKVLIRITKDAVY